MQLHNDLKEIQATLDFYKDYVNVHVKGWLYELDIILMSQILNWQMCIGIQGNICEIGVYHGKSAILLSWLRQTHEKLYFIDIFPGEMEQIARKNIETYGSKDNIQWIRLDTAKINSDDVKQMKPLRLLHIDGSHEHQSVLHELQLFTQCLHQENSVIVMDDFNDPEFPGVNSALFQFLLSDIGKDLRIFAIGANKAYLCKWDLMVPYQEMIIHSPINFNLNLTNVMQDKTLLVNSRYPKDKSTILAELRINQHNPL
jgi:cephalosporin hydroxylase